MYMDMWAYMLYTQMAEKVGQTQVHDATNLEDQKAVVDSMRSSKIEVRFEDLGSLEGAMVPNELKVSANSQSWRMNYEQAWNVHLSQRAQLAAHESNLRAFSNLRAACTCARVWRGACGSRSGHQKLLYFRKMEFTEASQSTLSCIVSLSVLHNSFLR